MKKYILIISACYLFSCTTSNKNEKLNSEDSSKTSNKKDTSLIENRLGMWEKHYLEDDFGDKTKDSYQLVVVKGVHTSSSKLNEDIYVRVHMTKDNLYFEFFNKDLSYKHILPEERGTIALKFTDNKVIHARVLLFNNMVAINKDKKINNRDFVSDYLINNNDEIKFALNLNFFRSSLTDVYNFSIKGNNLKKIM